MIGAEKYSAVKVISRGAMRIERPPTSPPKKINSIQ